ncbi:hypothetical protein GCM10012284_22500 [Mangrovihabitans endophyticus]|uniref:Alpha-1,6-mannosyltransferase n=1 Tax=Mangrovihabitans endophyticus TaxID=1751298 RepID=A0A8J3BZV8_9ACTN|nr:hypothetical protein GCM10012284_22500 [Mangrovihabitans endophyticus]
MAPARRFAPALVRFGGLAGSLLLAAVAWQHGARSPWESTMTAASVFAGREGVIAPLGWLVGIGLLITAWVAGLRVVPSARWAWVTAALWALPLLALPPLGSYDVHSYACQGYALSAGLDPYGAGPQQVGCPWLDAVAPTWRDSPAPYGPVFLVVAAAAAKLGGSLTGAIAILRGVAVAGVVLTGVCLPVLARRCGVPTARAAWLALACPLVAVHLISGAHNDALMVGLAVAGLAVAVRIGEQSRAPTAMPVAAGVLLGLAAGIKITAVVVLPFAVLVAVPPRARPDADRADVGADDDADIGVLGRLAALVRPAVAMVGGAVAALAAVSFASGLGLGWLANLAGSGASVQWTSLPTAVGMTADLVGRAFGVSGDTVPVARGCGLVTLAMVLVAFWWRTLRTGPDPRRAVYGAGLALAATVVFGPVFHPWYATWPLAVLAASMHRGTRWLVVPCAVASALCLPDGYNLALATKAQGALAMTAGVLVLAVWAHRRDRGPARPG